MAEEKGVDSDSLPTPPSVVPQEDQAESPTEDKTLPPLKTQNKLSVEEILKNIKQQVLLLLDKPLFVDLYKRRPATFRKFVKCNDLDIDDLEHSLQEFNCPIINEERTQVNKNGRNVQKILSSNGALSVSVYRKTL